MIYGLLAEVNIGKLLIAGIVPAIFVTAVIMATVWLLAWQDPKRAPLSPSVPLREKILRLRKVGPVLLLFGIVTGAIYTGITTPTEASAIGAFGALLLALASRRATLPLLRAALLRAALGSCMIAMMVVGAHVFGYFFALAHVTQDLIGWVSSLHVSRWLVIAVILVGYLLLGLFLDQMAILVLTVPVVLPLVTALGFDPIWFGIVKIVTAEVGMVTPPVGLNCFVVSRYSGPPVQAVFVGVLPHFVAHLLIIAVLTAFPQISLWLPSFID